MFFRKCFLVIVLGAFAIGLGACPPPQEKGDTNITIEQKGESPSQPSQGDSDVDVDVEVKDPDQVDEPGVDLDIDVPDVKIEGEVETNN